MQYEIKNIAGKMAKMFLHSPLTPILGVVILLLGYFALTFTPREEDPQIAVSGGSVIVMIPGLSAKEIRNVVVKPLERKLKEIKGIEHIYGYAYENYGVVNAMYYIGQNKEASDLKLYDKVMQNMSAMPKGAMPPLVRPMDIDIEVPIISVAFYLNNSTKLKNTDLYKEVSHIAHEINAIENVAKTDLKGAKKEQFNIEVDLGKLSGYHISLGQIAQALKSLSINTPNVTNTAKNKELVIFGVKNAIETIDDVKSIIIAQYMGSPVYLRDIANVYVGHDIQNKQEALISVRQENGFTSPKEQATLTISKLKGSNAVFIAQDIEDKLSSMKEALKSQGIEYLITRNYGKRANEAVNELVFHLLISIVIIAVLLVFVLGYKESLIVTFTVPAILSITLFVAYLTDQSVNRITLFAFLLSLGLLVDAAIIVIENIHRHLHAHDAHTKSMDEILIEATDEIGAPTNIATIAIILTMVPMAFVGQMMGQFMKPIPANVPVALAASLVVAYIFTPYLARKLLGQKS